MRIRKKIPSTSLGGREEDTQKFMSKKKKRWLADHLWKGIVQRKGLDFSGRKKRNRGERKRSEKE